MKKNNFVNLWAILLLSIATGMVGYLCGYTSQKSNIRVDTTADEDVANIAKLQDYCDELNETFRVDTLKVIADLGFDVQDSLIYYSLLFTDGEIFNGCCNIEEEPMCKVIIGDTVRYLKYYVAIYDHETKKARTEILENVAYKRLEENWYFL